jgi:Tfp pilus assembly protein PilW
MSTKTLQPRRQSGGAMIELMISMAISALVLTQICVVWYYSSRSFVAQLNYVDMDQISQRALDRLSREIRQTKALTGFSTNRLVFTDYDDVSLTYQFAEQELRRTKPTENNGRPTVLLRGCEAGAFFIYQRNPIAGKYDQYPAASPATCKLVEIQWKCKRKLIPSAPESKESMHSAKIVIRSNS